MSKPLRVILLEDSEVHADLIVGALESAGLRPIVERVNTRETFATALSEFEPDIVLSHQSNGHFSAPAAVDMVRANRPAVGLIVVADVIDGKTAVACIRAGVEDIVLKQNIGRLKTAIESARNLRKPLERLTPRQFQVLRLVAEGHTTREIAKRLHLSVKTVETHRGEIMKRVGIHDVVGLVRYAIRTGVIAQE